eukprot:IDg7027t1
MCNNYIPTAEYYRPPISVWSTEKIISQASQKQSIADEMIDIMPGLSVDRAYSKKLALMDLWYSNALTNSLSARFILSATPFC